MADVLKNMWGKVTVYCLNHEKPEKMEILTNEDIIKTSYYKCSAYDTQGCPNRLNLDDYQGIVLKIMDVMTSDPFMTNWQNYSFTYRGTRQKIDVTIIKHTEGEIRIGIMNRTVLGG